jgi:hypothetical protein
MDVGMNILISLALGIGLAAACGFRIFVPFALMSVAAQAGHLDLASGFEWIGTVPALLAFVTATVLEIVAYYIPWLDNLLDTVATPAAVIAGVLATASVITDMSPLMTWSVALIAGGGTAGIIQTGTVLLRGMSSVTTMGMGNFTVATGEMTGSVVTTILAILAPLMTFLLVAAALILVVRRFRFARQPHPVP